MIIKNDFTNNSQVPVPGMAVSIAHIITFRTNTTTTPKNQLFIESYVTARTNSF